MKYFKNTELAKLYNISEKSVRNWIDAAEAGKLDLQLSEVGGKFFVANTRKNSTLIEGLVEKGKKFKNSRGFKSITPQKTFYTSFNEKQILDILLNLSVHHEIPLSYTYVDGGADYWDSYANRLSEETTPNILTETTRMLKAAYHTLERLFAQDKPINVVDLGPGNGLPVRALLSHLIEQNKLNRYIAIDTSQDMLDILGNNLKKWFGGSINFEGHVRDFNYERFDDLCANYHFDNDPNALNLVLLLGGTPGNFKSPGHALQTIHSSMGSDDLLIFSGYLDTPSTRRYFDFNTSNSNRRLRIERIPELLGIEESFYDLDLTFDEKRQARVANMMPKIDLSIKVELPTGSRQIELKKHEPILLGRHWHKSTIDMINFFDQNDFDIVQTTKSTNDQYILLVSKIKSAL